MENLSEWINLFLCTVLMRVEWCLSILLSTKNEKCLAFVTQYTIFFNENFESEQKEKTKKNTTMSRLFYSILYCSFLFAVLYVIFFRIEIDKDYIGIRIGIISLRI